MKASIRAAVIAFVLAGSLSACVYAPGPYAYGPYCEPSPYGCHPGGPGGFLPMSN
jgi:hypothetical protein